jgi:hypothetical protein
MSNDPTFKEKKMAKLTDRNLAEADVQKVAALLSQNKSVNLEQYKNLFRAYHTKLQLFLFRDPLYELIDGEPHQGKIAEFVVYFKQVMANVNPDELTLC